MMISFSRIMPKKAKKHPGGRPSKYKPEYCQKIIEYMEQDGDQIYKPFAYEGDITNHSLGYLPKFFEGFARKIDVTTSTLAEWREVYPEFSEAYKKAKEIQLDRMIKGLVSGVYNSAGAIFAMKNMHGWRDKTETEHTGEIKIVLDKDDVNA